ncbi:hypothetical protein [Mycolicibacterium novocastrense]|uniref:hypothetical protein n=1 Tax=Mycolicibacterium novocastrense TaxID=59813 RepID=UPI001056D8E0|nr:hypothetical protein [Mycolicibacterium novocastrense]
MSGSADAFAHVNPVINDLKKRLIEDAPSPARLADTPGIVTLDAEWGAVATNVIDNALSHSKSIAIELPIDGTIDRVFARSGLYLALSRQRTLDWTRFDERQSTALKAWATDWRPADVRQPLFPIGLPDNSFEVDRRGDSPERELVAFLSADRVPRSEAMADQSVVVFPWLRDMVRHHDRLSVDTRETLLEETALAAQELLDNVRLHAKLDSSGLCYVSYSITGQANTNDLELHLTVLDTGAGIPTTAQRHYASPEPPEAIVSAALAGELRKRDRGRGLNRLAHLAERRGGRLFIATSAETGGAVIAECVQTAQAVVRHVDDLDLKGTVAVLTLPLADEPN